MICRNCGKSMERIIGYGTKYRCKCGVFCEDNYYGVPSWRTSFNTNVTDVQRKYIPNNKKIITRNEANNYIKNNVTGLKKIYEIRRKNICVKYKERHMLKQGCTNDTRIEGFNYNSELICVLNSKKGTLESIKKRKAEIEWLDYPNNLYFVTEYYAYCVYLNENKEEVAREIIGISNMKFGIYNKKTDKKEWETSNIISAEQIIAAQGEQYIIAI